MSQLLIVRGVNQLETALKALGGSATLVELNKEFKKQFGITFDCCHQKFLGAKKLKALLEKPYFIASFGAVREDNGWRIFLKSSHSERRPIAEPSPTENVNEKESRGIAQLKQALAACGGFATSEIWKAKFKQLFGVALDRKWLKRHFGEDRLVESIPDIPILKEEFIAVKLGLLFFRERTPELFKATKKENAAWLEKAVILKGVSQLESVLKALGGSARHDQLHCEYKKQFGISFEESCRNYFGVTGLKDLLEEPFFKSSFVAVQDTDRHWKIFIRSVAPTEEQPTAKNPVKTVAKGVQKAKDTQKVSSVRALADSRSKSVSPEKIRNPPAPSDAVIKKTVKRVKTVLQALGGSATLQELELKYRELFRVPFWKVRRLDFPEMTTRAIFELPAFNAEFFTIKSGNSLEYHLEGVSPEGRPIVTASPALNPEEMAARGIAQLKEALAACGGLATSLIWKMKFKQLFGVEPRKQWADDHFGVDRSEKSVYNMPIFKKEFIGTRIKSVGRIVYQERLREAVKAAEKENASQLEEALILKGVDQLKTVLKAMDGYATVAELDNEYQKKFGIPFGTSRKEYFGGKKLQSLFDKPYFTSTFGVDRDGDNQWKIFLKSSAPEISEDSEAPDTESRGIAQLKKALAACGGSATIEEWMLKFDEVFRVLPDKQWVDEHFGKDREVGLVNLPVFKNTFVQISSEPDIWKERVSTAAGEKEKTRQNHDSGETHTKEKKVKKAKSDEKPKTFEIAQKGVAVLQELLEACGGSAEFSELQKMYTRRFGGVLDEKWMEKHFGCSSMLSLTMMPIFNSLMVLEKNEYGMWYFRLLVQKGPKYPRYPGAALPAEDHQRRQGGHGSFDGSTAEMATVPQIVASLLELGGIASFATLAMKFKEKKLMMNTVSRLQEEEGFKEQVEVVGSGRGARLQLRSEDHWYTVEDRFLRILDYCDGQCTTSRFIHIYYRRFGVDLIVGEHVAEIITHFPSKEISISEKKTEIEGESATVFLLNGPQKETHEGRSRIYEALRKAGGRANITELRIAYEKIFPTSLSTDWERYFGTKNEREALPMLNNDKMFIMITERGRELFMKPICKGFYKAIAISAYGSILLPANITDEEMFSIQCTYIANQVAKTLRRLGGKQGRTRKELWEAVKGGSREDASVARFIIGCPFFLFQYMIRSKATMVGYEIFLNTHVPKPVLEKSVKSKPVKKLTRKQKEMMEEERRTRETQKLYSYYDAEDQLLTGKGHKTDHHKLVNGF